MLELNGFYFSFIAQSMCELLITIILLMIRKAIILAFRSQGVTTTYLFSPLLKNVTSSKSLSTSEENPIVVLI